MQATNTRPRFEVVADARASAATSVLRDLVVMLADGGDCVSDPASLRNQPELFGQVVSTPTARRILAEELPADPRGISGLWSALARVRERAWALGAAPAGPLILDMDATLVEAHSDKQGAAPTYNAGAGNIAWLRVRLRCAVTSGNARSKVGSTASRARTSQLPAPGSFVCRLFAA